MVEAKVPPTWHGQSSQSFVLDVEQVVETAEVDTPRGAGRVCSATEPQQQSTSGGPSHGFHFDLLHLHLLLLDLLLLTSLRRLLKKQKEIFETLFVCFTSMGFNYIVGKLLICFEAESYEKIG